MRFFPFILIMALAACGNPDDPTRTLAAPLLNGKPDPGHPAVGTVTGGSDNCTATLIGSKTVLLAAHCIQKPITYTFNLNGKSYAIDKLKPHTGWTSVTSVPEWPEANWMFSVADIGVVLLTNSITGVKPMRVALKKPAVGTAVTIIGFGSGKKEMAKNLVGRIGKNWICYGTKGGMKGTHGLTSMHDSGGPTLVMEDGEERILGVHSTSNSFGTYTQDTRVAPYWAWIKSQSSEITDPPDAGPPPKPDSSLPVDSGIPDTVAPGKDATVGREPAAKPEPDEGCSVGAGGVDPAALLLLAGLLFFISTRRRI